MDTILDTFSKADLAVAIALLVWLAALAIVAAWYAGRDRQAREDEPWMSLRG